MEKLKWFLSGLGLLSAVFSCVLLFNGTAKAYCSVIVSCSNGGTVSCAGDVCNGYSNRVVCSDSGKGRRTTYCSN